MAETPKAKLSQSPLCLHCEQWGRTVQANIVDHIVAIRNGGPAFPSLDGLQTLCQACHNRKTHADVRGTQHVVKGYDPNGNPIDGNHSWHTGASLDDTKMDDDLLWPLVGASRIPLTILFGPPAAGKSTYATTHAEPSDLIIDLDTICLEATGKHRDHTKAERVDGLKQRNMRLIELATYAGEAQRAWFITTAPMAATRKQWVERLQPDTVLLIAAPKADLMRRVRKDPHRRQRMHSQRQVIERWFATFTPGIGTVVDMSDTQIGGGHKDEGGLSRGKSPPYQHILSFKI